MPRKFKNTSAKPDVVSVVRYFRNWDFDNGQISSHGGLTVVAQLNYKTNTMTIYPSICMDKDNFSKSIGAQLAYNNLVHGNGFSMPFDKTQSIKENILSAWENEEINEISTEAYRKLWAPLNNWIESYGYHS